MGAELLQYSLLRWSVSNKSEANFTEANDYGWGVALFCSPLGLGPGGWERTQLQCEICPCRRASCQDGSFPSALIQLIQFLTYTRLPLRAQGDPEGQQSEVIPVFKTNLRGVHIPQPICRLRQESEIKNSNFRAHEEPEALCPHCTPGTAQAILAPRKSKLRRIPVLKAAQKSQELRVLGQPSSCPGRDGH